MPLTFNDVWNTIADAVPDEVAVIQGDRRVTWREYESRAARLAGAFADAGLGHDSKVGLFLYNSPEYLEAQFATFKIQGSPINVNYRYLDDELWYLLDNAECEAVVFHSSLGDRIERIRSRLPLVKVFIEVADDDNRCPGAVAYEDLLRDHDPHPRLEGIEDDVYMLYTGGTTGMPKGVMYSLGGFSRYFLGVIAAQAGIEPFTTPDEVAGFVRMAASVGLRPTAIPACPLMHGTGMWLGGMVTHLAGGTVVLLDQRHLDVDELWRAVEDHGVNSIVIVGDAFARPMLRALDDRLDAGSPYGTESVTQIVSSGAMFSQEVKQGLVGHIPQLNIVDVLGSTEGGMGQNVTAADTSTETAKFALNPGVMVFDERDRPVEPGSGVVGMVASTSANVPLGYFKDPEKTARTFREIDGVRYTFHGDMATVEADGSINLLGRGSNCINTGGEKVFPEEVEEAVKTYEAVHDCLVFGVDDERFGQRVVGVASLEAGTSVEPEQIIEHTREVLSHFKVPRQLTIVDRVPRAPNGKADYVTAKEISGLS